VLLVPPPLLAVAAGLAQRALAGAAPAPGRARIAVTATVSTVSMTIAGAAASRFRRAGTSIDAVHPESASVLVTTGAHSISRNPMYVGLTGLLVAHAIWRRSWAALLPVAGFVAIIDRFQIPAEESALAAKFGTEYAAYRAASPRWLDQRSFRRPRPGRPQ
jgi:protein-S-isoprenylcysteine O-methyltransferase Ste14